MLVAEYEAALVAGKPAAAWALLGDEARVRSGGEAAFGRERTQFFTSVRGRVDVNQPLKDPAAISEWLLTYVVAADLTRAYLVRVDFPAIAANTNANYEILLVAPDPRGSWRIWPLR
jgi:hypothetical protein